MDVCPMTRWMQTQFLAVVFMFLTRVIKHHPALFVKQPIQKPKDLTNLETAMVFVASDET